MKVRFINKKYPRGFTPDKVYDVIEVVHHPTDPGDFAYKMVNDFGGVHVYLHDYFEIVDIPTEVFCPIVGFIIPAGECVENRDEAAGFFKPSLHYQYKTKPDWKEICKSCGWHNFN